MIPIVIYDKEGNYVGMQSFNDNVSVVEQINRAFLRAVVLTPKTVLDQKNVVEKLVDAGVLTAKQTDAVYTAINTYNKAVDTALSALKTSVQTVADEAKTTAEQ